MHASAHTSSTEGQEGIFSEQWEEKDIYIEDYRMGHIQVSLS